MKHFNLKRSLGLVLLCCMFPLSALAQQITVKGKVTDSNGDPLVGAGVVVRSTVNGTVTDFDGNYQISVNPDAELVFSSLGFVDQVVPVDGRAQINVVLKEDSQLMDEAVVIGYGTARRSDVTGSIASMGGQN